MLRTSKTIAGIDLAYEERGAGKPVLFIHGFGGSGILWRRVGQDLGPGYRVIAVDLKGSGNSSKPRDGNYSAQDQAVLVREFIAAMELEDLVIVGHSIGGGVALIVSASLESASPRVVRGLVLLDTMAYPQQIPGFIASLRIPVIGCLGIWLVPPATNSRAILRKIHYSEETVTDQLVDTYARLLSAPGAREALLATARQIVPANADEIVASYGTISVPTLVIWGEHDVIIPLQSGRRLVQALSDARLVILADCGHAPHEEKPDDVARVVSEFLQGLHMQEEEPPG